MGGVGCVPYDRSRAYKRPIQPQRTAGHTRRPVCVQITLAHWTLRQTASSAPAPLVAPWFLPTSPVLCLLRAQAYCPACPLRSKERNQRTSRSHRFETWSRPQPACRSLPPLPTGLGPAFTGITRCGRLGHVGRSAPRVDASTLDADGRAPPPHVGNGGPGPYRRRQQCVLAGTAVADRWWVGQRARSPSGGGWHTMWRPAPTKCRNSTVRHAKNTRILGTCTFRPAVCRVLGEAGPAALGVWWPWQGARTVTVYQRSRICRWRSRPGETLNMYTRSIVMGLHHRAEFPFPRGFSERRVQVSSPVCTLPSILVRPSWPSGAADDVWRVLDSHVARLYACLSEADI